MIETKRETINGREWQCTQFSGTKNLDLFHSLSTVLAPAMARAVNEGRGDSLLDSDIDVVEVVDALIKGIGTRDSFRDLVFRLTANTHVDGTPMSVSTFDNAFAGPRILDLAPVIMFCIRTNFGDFSKLAGSIIDQYAPRRGNGEPMPVDDDSQTNSKDTQLSGE